MRMMKINNNETVMVIGIDHGYGNMKTATRCFPSGVARYDKEPIFQNNLLVYNGMYYQIGEEHKEFCADKTYKRCEKCDTFFLISLGDSKRTNCGNKRDHNKKSKSLDSNK